MTPEQRKTISVRCGECFQKVYRTKEEADKVITMISDVLREEKIKGIIPCIKSVPGGYFVMTSDSAFLKGI